jgi:uncharacterized protein
VIFKTHHTIPRTPWTAKNHWDLSFTRVLILFIGLALFGFGEAFLINSYLGNTPWAVFSQGLSKHIGLNLGWSTFIISGFILLIWLALKQKPGFGTISNMILIAYFLQFGTTVLPVAKGHLLYGLLEVVAGITVTGIGSALYITCGLGPGPRDGLMTAIHYRTGVRVLRVRAILELSVLVVGIILGGRFGIGTIIYALTIGYSVAFFMGVVHKLFPVK